MSTITSGTNDSLPPISSLIRTEACTNSPVSGEVLLDETKDIATTRWIKLQTLTYKLSDNPSRLRYWDMATRTTKSTTTTTMKADAVAILARLKLADDVPRILLVKQYRPAIDSITVELPAGLIDKNETAEMAALRELEEETGFKGIIKGIHNMAPLSPGLSNEMVNLVHVDVIEKVKNGQNLDEGENIHVVSVPLNRMKEALDYMEEKEGCKIMHAVSTLAVGYALAQSQMDLPQLGE